MEEPESTMAYLQPRRKYMKDATPSHSIVSQHTMELNKRLSLLLDAPSQQDSPIKQKSQHTPNCIKSAPSREFTLVDEKI